MEPSCTLYIVTALLAIFAVVTAFAAILADATALLAIFAATTALLAILAATTALFLILGVVTALLLSCAVPTLFLRRRLAHGCPASASENEECCEAHNWELPLMDGTEECDSCLPPLVDGESGGCNGVVAPGIRRAPSRLTMPQVTGCKRHPPPREMLGCWG